MAHAFGDFRRSTAIMQLATMRQMGLLTDVQLGKFSEHTQQTVRGLDSLGDTKKQTAHRLTDSFKSSY